MHIFSNFINSSTVVQVKGFKRFVGISETACQSMCLEFWIVSALPQIPLNQSEPPSKMPSSFNSQSLLNLV